MSRRFAFVGSTSGPWRVTRITSVSGEPLPPCDFVSVVPDPDPNLPALSSSADTTAAGCGSSTDPAVWVLNGVTSNDRYVTRPEKQQLVAVQQPLGRTEATHAALIPMRKSAAWWALTQDERRAIFEDQSHHVALGLQALPAVARRLHHCRDLGLAAPEPFDFVTWFEYRASDEHVFDALLTQLRASPEWGYVDREVDIRLERVHGL